MLGLELFSESAILADESCNHTTKKCAEGDDYSPEEDVAEINESCLQESIALETACLLAANKHAKLLFEGKQEEAETLQEGVVKNFLGKVKALILKMWAKIKQFFSNVKLFFNKLIQKESKFAETYEDEIKAITTVTIQGYNFKPDAVDIKSAWGPAMAIYKKYAPGIEKSLDDKMKTAATSVGHNMNKTADSISATNEFSKLANEKFSKKALLIELGKTPKTVDVKFSGSQLYTLLTSLNKNLNAISADQNEIDSAYKEAISNLDAMSTKLESAKAEGSNAVVSQLSSLLKTALGTVNMMASIKSSVYKEQAGQAKKAAYKGIAESRKGSKTAVKESFNVADLYRDLLG